MPPRRTRPYAAPQGPPEPPSTLRRLLAGATRVAGGLYPLGGPIGAGLAGGAEALAEKIEGTPVDPRRMAVEGAIGAVPVLKYIQGGRALASALKTGALTGVGEAGRQVTRGEEFDPQMALLAAGAGAATGGLLGRLGGPPTKPVAPRSAPEAHIDPKERAAFVKTLESELGRHLNAIPSGAKRDLKSFLAIEQETKRSVAMTRSAAQREAARIEALEQRADMDWMKREADAFKKQRADAEIQESIESGGLIRQEPRIAESLRGERLSQTVGYRQPPAAGSPQRQAYDRLIAEGFEPNQALDALPQLARRGPTRVKPPSAPAIVTAGPKEAADAAASSGVAALEDLNKTVGVEDIPTPVGARGTEDTNSLLAKLLQSLEARQGTPAAAPANPLVGMLRPDKPQTAIEQAGIFRAPADVAGTAYRTAATDPDASKLSKQYLGVSLKNPERLSTFLGKEVEPRLAASGEAIPGGGIPRAPQGPEVSPQGPVGAASPLPDRPLLTSADLRQAMGVNEKTIDRWVKAGLIPGATRVGRQWRFRREEIEQALEAGTLGRPKPRIGGEAGFAVPELMLGLGGAAVGAVADPFDNPVVSALAVGSAGLATPSIIAGIRSLGVAPERLGNIEQELQTPEGTVSLARKIARALPHFQRANYLWDQTGLPANMAAGPWGAVATGALIKGLSGDPRGWAVLKSGDLSPERFLTEMWKNKDEALELVRRSDTGVTRFIESETPISKDIPPGFLRTHAELPAQGMAAGDIAARQILMRHGFSEDEARLLTHTAEPELPFTSSLARLRKGVHGKRSPLMEMLLPFVRTPANLLEGAAHSTPGLGFITAQMMKAPPSLREQAVMQGMGTGAALGGYAIGNELDPETARATRKFVTNLAGRQGVLAGLGFTAGQANRYRQPVVSTQTLMALQRSLPLPTAEPLTDIIGSVAGQGRVPRGAVPGYLYELMYPRDTPRRLQTVASGRRSGPRRRRTE